ESWIARGEADQAKAGLERLWQQDPSPSTAGFVVARFEALRGRVPLVRCRVAILRSFTVEPVVPLLRAAAFAGGIDLEVELGAFNSYTQEILAPESALYAFAPGAVILAVQTRDVAPALWSGFAGLAPADVEETVRSVSAQIGGLVEKLRERSAAAIVVHTLETPDEPALGALDAALPLGQNEAIRRINRHLVDVARAHRGVHVLDVDALMARRGRGAFRDERKWLTARMPYAAGELVHVAREWLRFLHPIAGRVAKVVACDLDNTLWGGVIGEDGLGGIQVGPEYKGAAHLELQRALLDLTKRGILLAISSKNNPAEALEAIDKHPGMLLRREHFAAVRINWTDKAENLRSIAEELNVGVDAIAFLDDNPVEREWVRSRLPAVPVIDLPDSPMGYARAVRGCPLFERLELTAEDRERGRHYAEQRMRAELREATGSLEDFYRSLEQEVSIDEVGRDLVARVAQLTQKTNQWNLTTRRYSEVEIEGLTRSGSTSVYALRVRDRFGDNGITGAAVVHHRGDRAEIDTLLLSCRVIGRTVETAFLSFLTDAARARGAKAISGWFLPTKKNAPAKDVYASHGFSREHEDGDATEWTFDLSRRIPWPEWIEKGPHAAAAEETKPA
ncbi:MAG TPA: HAD-IIIC family phosphatase, partial [Polyangia bacterium]|nr:HAD-IIIC family phosphatase [Polyangia bacterium]